MTPETTTNPDQLGHFQRELAHEMDLWDRYEALAGAEPVTVIDGR